MPPASACKTLLEVGLPVLYAPFSCPSANRMESRSCILQFSKAHNWINFPEPREFASRAFSNAGRDYRCSHVRHCIHARLIAQIAMHYGSSSARLVINASGKLFLRSVWHWHFICLVTRIDH